MEIWNRELDKKIVKNENWSSFPLSHSLIQGMHGLAVTSQSTTRKLFVRARYGKILHEPPFILWLFLPFPSLHLTYIALPISVSFTRIVIYCPPFLSNARQSTSNGSAGRRVSLALDVQFVALVLCMIFSILVLKKF